jgi:biotin carboxyl carrier protein
MKSVVDVNGRSREVEVERAGTAWRVSVDGQSWSVDAARIDRQTLSLLVGQSPALSREVTLTSLGQGRWSVRVGSAVMTAAMNGGRRSGRRADTPAGGAGRCPISAPMPGRVVRVLVAEGDLVRARQPLVVVEAMKMENELRAPGDGVVVKVSIEAGQSVEAGAVLAVLDLRDA